MTEEHRASTPLELLFDLSFVVAVSQAGVQLDRALSIGHYRTGIVGYLMVFFAIWWAWVNFTWFASAYDVDDLAYRLLTFVQIVGVLILAAGVANAFDGSDFAYITVGYVVMRTAMVAQWLRVASDDAVRRPVALRYATGIAVLQVGWVLRLFVPHEVGLIAFYVLALGEMLVPAWAERGGRNETPWHPGHIAERYGLFTLIVLGECIAAATVTIRSATAAHGLSVALCAVAAGGVLLVCSVWWWYFEHPSEDGLRLERQIAFVWGYGHYFVFASVAALGTGLEMAAASTHRVQTAAPAVTAGLAVGVALAVYLVVTGVLQGLVGRGRERPGRLPSVLVAVVLVLVIGGLAGELGIGLSTLLMGLIVVALVVFDERQRGRSATLR